MVVDIQIMPITPPFYQKNLDFMNKEIKRTYFLARSRPISREESQNFMDFLESAPDNTIYLIALHREKIIGNIYMIPRSEDLLTHIAQIGFQVDFHFHNRGIGTQMMRELIRRCNKSEIEGLTAEVVQKNTACIALLSKFNFENVGKISKGVKIPYNEYQDLLIFHRIL
ncbi:MAG: GNAT family N-acetyltransferase [Promethearchaeota archaeon]